MSTPSPKQLSEWRVFLETAYALSDILDAELQAECGMPLRWYDVLVHLEDTDEGARMNELADAILSSKSGLTRVIDRMEEAGLVRRERPSDDRRVVNVLLTPRGRETLQATRAVHRRGIDEHFFRHVDPDELTALAHALERVRDHVRARRRVKAAASAS